MGFFRLLFAIFRNGITKIIDKIILSLPIYYTRMDKISIARWFEVMGGKFNKLYKYFSFKYIPYKFLKISEDMYFQLDQINTEIIQKEAELAILYSMAARLNNKSMLFNADQQRKKLNEEKENLSKKKPLKINDFLNYIELTLNKNIDPEKMSASRAFSLFHIAVERNKIKENVSYQ
jgi:hypothetical protein